MARHDYNCFCAMCRPNNYPDPPAPPVAESEIQKLNQQIAEMAEVNRQLVADLREIRRALFADYTTREESNGK